MTTPAQKSKLKTIFINKPEIEELSRLTGRNIDNRGELIAAVRRLSTISVNGQEITLEPYLLQRLDTRRLKEPMGEYLDREIKRLLCGFAGC